MSDIEIYPLDIASDGYVRIYRQRTDMPFLPENIMNIENRFSSIEKLHSAVAASMKIADEVAAIHPLAWNPEFGYVTARPDFCGTGLEISMRFHLEGLHLIGDLEPTLNALAGMRMGTRSYDGDGIKAAAHIYRVSNISKIGIDEHEIMMRVKRIFADLVKQESNARIRLVEELPLVLGDAISRSIAILRSCRLLSEWEFLDIISPLRIAAELDFLDNFTREDAFTFTKAYVNLRDSARPTTYEEMRERDRRDAAFAAKANRRFKNVRLNARGKDYLS